MAKIHAKYFVLVNGNSFSQSLKMHEGAFKAIIKEKLRKEGFRLPNNKFKLIFWNWVEITPNSRIYRADAHVHLNKMGENTTDYILHYPSGAITKFECSPGYAGYSD